MNANDFDSETVSEIQIPASEKEMDANSVGYTLNQEKPRCDFYYVLMSEEGEYFESFTEDNDPPGIIRYRLTGLLGVADKWWSEDSAKIEKERIILNYGAIEAANPKVYKVHSPIIECCEVDVEKINAIRNAGMQPLNDVMKKW